MADQETGGTLDVATLEGQDAASEQETAQEEAQPEALTVKHLAEAVTRLQQEMAKGWSSAESASARRILEANNLLRAEIAELRAQGSETIAAQKRLTRSLLTQEQVAEYEAEVETDALRERVKALEAKPAQADGSPSEQEVRQWEFETHHFPGLQRRAQSQGLNLMDPATWATVSKGVAPLRTGETWDRYESEIEANIAAESDRRAKSQEVKPRNDSARPGGGGTASIQARYDDWIAGKGPPPSSAEIDSLTKKY